jgi:hypothetical protein
LPGDYQLATTLAAAVFSLHRDQWTPGQQAKRIFWHGFPEESHDEKSQT